MNLTDLAKTARNQWLTAQINSNVRTNLQIVGVQELDFNETNRIDLFDVDKFRDNLVAQQLRDEFEADLMLLFANGSEGNYNSFSGYVDTIAIIESNAHAIVQVAYATSSFTWIHEVGHLFGARHDNDPVPGDAHRWSTGWFFWKKLSLYYGLWRPERPSAAFFQSK